MTTRSKTLLFISVLLLSCSDPVVQPASVTQNRSQIIDDFPPIPCPGQFFCFSNHDFDSVNYIPFPSFPAAFGASAALGDQVFFGGGHEEGAIGFAMADVNAFSINRYGWRHAVLSVPRSHLAAASAGDKVLFAGGDNIASMNPVYGAAPLEYYDIVDMYNSETLARDVVYLSEARGYLSSVSTATKAYFFGGKSLLGYSSKMDIYDAELDLWTVGEMPRPRAYSSAVAVNSKIYICGGQNSSDGNLTVIDVYDIQTGQWSSIEAPHEHPIAAAVVLGDRIFIVGGDGYSNNAVDIFNTVDMTWTSTTLSDSRYNIAAASAANKVIFFGGSFSRTVLSPNVDVYDEPTDSWSVATLSDGVTGVAAASAVDICFFTAFLYENGNALTNSMMIIQP